VTSVLNPEWRGQEQCLPFQSDTRVRLGIAERYVRFPDPEARFRCGAECANITDQLADTRRRPCTNRALMSEIQAIRATFERKADSPNC